MSFIDFHIILFFSISNQFIFCKFGLDNDSISSSLLESVEKARTNLKEFQELYKLTRDEILKFDDIIKTIPNHDSYTHNRFTQVSEPANEGKIRESLYVTQLKRSSPQSTVSIDVKENVGDVVKNSTEINSFTEDPYENYFEDELRRMESEISSKIRLKSIYDSLSSLGEEVERLMTPKDSIKKLTSKESTKKEESVGKLVCEGSNYS